MNTPQFIKLPFLILLISLLISSCVSRKQVAYFQDLEEMQMEVSSAENDIKIQPKDELRILVLAPEQEAVTPFNLSIRMAVGGGGNNNAGGNTGMATYIVSESGEIKFPVLGEISVEGLTRYDLEKQLEEKISRYVQDPVVNVRIINFQITFLGEVTGTINIPNDQITLSKALGLVGGIPFSGKQKNIVVIREVDGKRTQAILDITDADIMNSPYYYLKQNDIIYIEPTAPRRQSAGYLGTVGTYLGISSAVISLIFLFTR